ncbi:DUF3823 domain-containing protein [Thalassoroseus pseudoceratinae]|uniref:DUF3823 domain-containing protein n=1 Tax=Thalassoroseus pseudoceratinae TaxID=2713176 RepID=UPI00141F2C15|nr:DUF3823 domain-containing protein [Thalassoroseus pseudoceratinae]
MTTQRGLLRVFLPLLPLFLIGCGGSGEVEVQGKLTSNGEPLQVSENGDVQVTFVQVEGGSQTGHQFLASPDDSGQYSVTLPTGEYKVAVVQLDPYPDTDKLEGQFSQDTTPIEKTIDGSETWDIELNEYAGN